MGPGGRWFQAWSARRAWSTRAANVSPGKHSSAAIAGDLHQLVPAGHGSASSRKSAIHAPATAGSPARWRPLSKQVLSPPGRRSHLATLRRTVQLGSLCRAVVLGHDRPLTSAEAEDIWTNLPDGASMSRRPRRFRFGALSSNPSSRPSCVLPCRASLTCALPPPYWAPTELAAASHLLQRWPAAPPSSSPWSSAWRARRV
jgi:hypothetical protein